jgi:hypothetical protein
MQLLFLLLLSNKTGGGSLSQEGGMYRYNNVDW